jgi:hypothetical protein
MTTPTDISRRGALSALAAFTAVPSISLPASAEPKINTDLLARFLWIERQTNIELLFRVSAEYKKAAEKLPAWAKTGFDSIDQDGKARIGMAWSIAAGWKSRRPIQSPSMTRSARSIM